MSVPRKERRRVRCDPGRPIPQLPARRNFESGLRKTSQLFVARLYEKQSQGFWRAHCYLRFSADCRFGRGRSYASSLRRERLDVEEATLNEGTEEPNSAPP